MDPHSLIYNGYKDTLGTTSPTCMYTCPCNKFNKVGWSPLHSSVISHVSGRGNRIGPVRLSFCLSVSSLMAEPLGTLQHGSWEVHQRSGGFIMHNFLPPAPVHGWVNRIGPIFLSVRPSVKQILKHTLLTLVHTSQNSHTSCMGASVLMVQYHGFMTARVIYLKRMKTRMCKCTGRVKKGQTLM